jgi:hypothetical protein
MGDKENQLLFWLYSLHSRLGNSQLLIVGTFFDELLKTEGELGLEKKNKEICDTVEEWKRATNGDGEFDIVNYSEYLFWPVDARDVASVGTLRQAIVDLSALIANRHPCDWDTILLVDHFRRKNAERKEARKKLIYSKAEVQEVIKSAYPPPKTINEQQIQHYFGALQRLGEVKGFPVKLKRFGNKFIANPRYIADTFGTLFNQKSKAIIKEKEGIIDRDDLTKMKQGPFSIDETIDLLRSFNLLGVYKVAHEKFVVPAFVKGKIIEWLPFLREHHVHEMIGLSHTSDFLPPGLFHQACVSVVNSLEPKKARLWRPQFFQNGVAFFLQELFIVMRQEDRPVAPGMEGIIFFFFFLHTNTQ